MGNQASTLGTFPPPSLLLWAAANPDAIHSSRHGAGGSSRDHRDVQAQGTIPSVPNASHPADQEP